MLTLSNITLRRGPHILLRDVNWTIYHKQKIGIIGVNGSGKSSLFSLLLNEIQSDEGEVEIPRQIRLAHVAQDSPHTTQSALEFVLDGDDELRKLEHELLEAEHKHDGMRIAILHERLAEIDAYTAKTRAAKLLAGLGFSHDEQQQSVSDFSGGWRVRLNLAKALMCRSDILLLDEPTNHLDLDAVLWLEQWLIKYPGTLLIISHDRDFLDRVVEHIAHIFQQQLKVYTGNYSAFEKLRAEAQLQQQALYEKQKKKMAHLQSFIDRFRAGTKATQAQSRLKALERMETLSAVQIDSPLQFSFKEPSKCPNPLINIENATASYGDKKILTHINFSITPGDRIAFLGPNGAGKTTFIKLLSGALEPASGSREAGPGLKIGYFAQHQIDTLHAHETPLQHLQTIAPQASEQTLRTYLGGFDFSGDRIKEPVKNFSGGEKSRLALALIIWEKPNLLLLDEPTNHLDLEMRNALSMALQEYEGAMILVSHDRFLVRTTVDSLMLIADQQLKSFDGDLNDYEKWLFQYRKQALSSVESPEKKPVVSQKEQRQLEAKLREERRPLLLKIQKLETQLNKLQKEEAAMEITLGDLSLYEEQNKETLQKKLLKQTEIKKQLKLVENEWLAAQEALDIL